MEKWINLIFKRKKKIDAVFLLPLLFVFHLRCIFFLLNKRTETVQIVGVLKRQQEGENH